MVVGWLSGSRRVVVAWLVDSKHMVTGLKGKLDRILFTFIKYKLRGVLKLTSRTNDRHFSIGTENKLNPVEFSAKNRVFFPEAN